MINKKPLSPQEALKKLADLCAKAEHSEWELREKLKKWQITPKDADKIIDWLTDNRYIDNTRFAQAYVNDKAKFARWGKRKIYQGLLQKRVPAETIKEALDSIDPDTYATNLRQLLKSKIKASPALTQSYEGRTKLYRAALSRGYEPAIASETLKSLLAETIN